MLIEMPNNFNVALEKTEKEAIQKCMNVLTEIQDAMDKHDCDTLISEYDDIITYGEIDDIITELNTIFNAIKIY